MTRSPFNPTDPFDAMCENFRRQVVDMALKADTITLYRDLGKRQVEAFVAGTLTGLIGVALATYRPEAHAEVLQGIRGYIDDACVQTLSIIGGAEQLVTNDRPDPELDRTLSAVNDAINQPGE